MIHENRPINIIPEDEMVVGRLVGMFAHVADVDFVMAELTNTVCAVLIRANVRGEGGMETESRRADGGICRISHAFYYLYVFEWYFISESHADLTSLGIDGAVDARFLYSDEGVGRDIADRQEVCGFSKHMIEL